jgi:hypothetical protein
MTRNRKMRKMAEKVLETKLGRRLNADERRTIQRMRMPNVCVLCEGGPIAWMNFFFASEKYSQVLGAPLGKQRIIFCVLCAQCFRRSGGSFEKLSDRIEEKMFQDLVPIAEVRQ